VVGFKPTHGLISRHGVLTLSRTLDHVGLFARSIDDVALLAEPDRWLRREKDIAKKVRYGYCRCEEPVNYVSEIQNRYDHYVQIVPMQ
jgi:hypothetical protein